ncbi:MAG: hypothetical protein K0Q54_3636 [Methylobacterium brachiatum]|jgi:hypothetical protein|nr:hypothetical protein [Methylobacterium brachiatum]
MVDVRVSAVSSVPLTMIRPPSCVSMRLMHRMSVDLPEPDGPQTTIFSPGATLSRMSVSA